MVKKVLVKERSRTSMNISINSRFLPRLLKNYQAIEKRLYQYIMLIELDSNSLIFAIALYLYLYQIIIYNRV